MQSYNYIVDVDKHGQIKVPNILQVKSSKVEIRILPLEIDDYSDLMKASESSTDFWDNPDDEVWNHV